MTSSKLHASGRIRFCVRDGTAALHMVNVSRDVLVLPSQIITEGGDALPLTEIGWESFYQTMARCIILPDSVQRIGVRAFARSSTLQAVYIPASVKMIDRSSFLDSYNLVLYVEPGSYADRYAKALRLNVAYGVPQITRGMNRDIVSGDWVYRLSEEGKAILREYTGDASVLSIPAQVDGYDVVRLDRWCFDSLHFLEAVVIPEGVTSVGQECFGRCIYLESVTMPQTVQWLEKGAFANCKQLHDVVLSDAIRAIPGLCFAECRRLRDLALPADLRHIGSMAFLGCRNLGEVELPQGVEAIEPHAFIGCSGLRHIFLNEGLSYVSPTAFETCENLFMPDLPASLPTRCWQAFRSCIGAEDLDWPQA